MAQSSSSSSTPHMEPHLAPLEFLQNNRRGSITDPSLHAAASSATRRSPTTTPSSRPAALSRPPSTYVFGNATPRQVAESSSSASASSSRVHQHVIPKIEALDDDILLPRLTPMSPQNGGKGGDSSRSMRPPSRGSSFDYGMRRHSFAAHAEPQSVAGKRKMSTDLRALEEGSSLLMGPGMSTEGPALKRRGSIIDTHRISSLSLNDRRGSTESTRWWMQDRRDSTSSALSSSSASAGHQSPRVSRIGTAAPSSFATFSWATPSVLKTEHGAMQQPPALDHQQNGTTHRPAFDQPIDMANMMPPMGIVQDRRLADTQPDTSSTDSANNQSRVLRSRSRPPSRQMDGLEDSLSQQQQQPDFQGSPEDDMNSPGSASAKLGRDSGVTPYSRSPELRVSHKLAERKRRKEMKDLFDDLRESLPADRGMKASKWEILSKSIEFIAQLKQSHQDMAREIDLLRHELEISRGGGVPQYPPGGPHGPQVVYTQHPGLPPGYTLPPGATMPPQQQAAGVAAQPPHPPQQQPISRPSSQNTFTQPPGGPTGPLPSQQQQIQQHTEQGERQDAPP